MNLWSTKSPNPLFNWGESPTIFYEIKNWYSPFEKGARGILNKKLNRMKAINQKTIAIIPARGGSVSIPRKNIKKLGNIPLIAYSIEAALESNYIDRVIVSTDDKEIAQVAIDHGAEVPFIRPGQLAQNDTTDLPVFQHAITWLEENEMYKPDWIIQLRPTSPFRPQGMIDHAFAKILTNNSDSLRCVTPSGENPYKMWSIQNGLLQQLIQTGFKEPYNMPRQQLPETYWQTGHLEIIHYNTIMKKNSMTGDIIQPYVIDPKFVIDLDNMVQWQYAEFLLSEIKQKIVMPGEHSPVLQISSHHGEYLIGY